MQRLNQPIPDQRLNSCGSGHLTPGGHIPKPRPIATHPWGHLSREHTEGLACLKDQGDPLSLERTSA